MTTSVIEGTVKYTPGKVFPSDYSETGRVNTVFDTATSGEIKVWTNTDDAGIQALRKGDKRLLTQNKRGKWQMLETVSESATQLQSQIYSPQNAEQAFEELLRSKARRYGKCLKAARFTVEKELPLTEENMEDLEMICAIKDVATTLFIQCHRT